MSRCGDLDLPLDSEEPVAPCTCEATRLDNIDFVTASTMIKELVASFDASTTSPSVIGMRYPVSAIINDGSAMASSPSGDPTLKRVVVQPLVEDNSMIGPHLPKMPWQICFLSYG